MVNQDLSQLTAYVVVQSPEGRGAILGENRLRPALQAMALPETAARNSVANELESRGLRVQRIGRLAIAVTAPAEVFRQRFGLEFEKRDPAPGLDREFIIETPYTPTPTSKINLMDAGIGQAEGLVFPQPIALHGVSANPPDLKYHHLRIPGDIVSGMNAGPVHDQGILGRGVRAAMIDSGFEWDHPYFATRGYDLDATKMAGANRDRSGHGTGESANFLAVAPEAKLFGLPVADPVAAIQAARDDLTVDLISNSWGPQRDTDGPGSFWDPYWELLEAEIALCVQGGIAVLFSAGNGSQSFTASMPETISVGGVYLDEAGNLRASDYASSFESTRYPGSHVPEICGLVGMQPNAIYITLPVPPGSDIDRQFGGTPYPLNDETATDDGWAVFSGTSAACPMVAGVVALIQSKFPDAGLNSIRNRLYAARDVTEGRTYHGDAAGPGYDKATGFGLVDAERACR